jgi:predicted MPP superfamily phosphohydrolase
MKRFLPGPIPVIMAALHTYVGVRLLGPFGHDAQAAGAAYLVLSFLLMPRSWWMRERLRVWMVLIPWAVAGSFSWLLVLTLVRDATLLAATVALSPAASLAWARDSALAVMLLTPAISVVGFLMARRVAAVRQVDVQLAGLPAALEGFTIAQISDIHVGPTIKREFVQRIVDRVNGMDADMVAITGDLVDGSVARPRAPHRAARRLQSRHGTYFVTGNHEYYSGARRGSASCAGSGMRADQRARGDRARRRDDRGGRRDGLLRASLQSRAPQRSARRARRRTGGAVKVLLAHQPRSAHRAEDAGFDLQLSGHTHGGQFWPWNLFVRLQQPFTAGLHRIGLMWIYISRGTGYWGPPMRFGAPSEITRIRLVRA